MSRIVTLAGSPTQPSRSAAVLEYTSALIEARGFSTTSISVRELPAEDLLFANAGNAAIQRAVALIESADALIIATPVYKAAYSGLLKTFLDLLPQTALEGKVVLPIATGGSPAHLLAINYAIKPVLAALGAQHILNGVYVVDSQLPRVDGQGYELDAEAEQRLSRSVDALLRVLGAAPVAPPLLDLPLAVAR